MVIENWYVSNRQIVEELDFSSASIRPILVDITGLRRVSIRYNNRVSSDPILIKRSIADDEKCISEF